MRLWLFDCFLAGMYGFVGLDGSVVFCGGEGEGTCWLGFRGVVEVRFLGFDGKGQGTGKEKGKGKGKMVSN